MEIVLATGAGRRTLWRCPGDSFFNFAEVGWSPDERLVGVVAQGTPGPMKFAFETSSGKEAPFDTVRSLMETTIREHYRVPPGVSDAVLWTRQRDALDQFREREAAGATR